MKPSMPFFDLVARVPLRDLVPEGMVVEDAVVRISTEDVEGRESGGSAKGMSGGDTVAGTERRLAAMVALVGKRSLRVAVFAREGRGGGEVIVGDFECTAKGSWSRRDGCCVDDERLCLRPRGCGFWSELRTLGGESTGVFDLKDGGGGGACLVGLNVVVGGW